MKDVVIQPPPRPSHAVLRDRCRDMGVPTWRYSPTGHIVAAPSEGGACGAWLRSPAIERVVDKQARAWNESGEFAPAEPFPGCLLLPLTEQHRRRRRGMTVAMLLSPSALHAEQFELGCQSASLDGPSTRKAMESVARFGPQSAVAMASVLRWMHSDLQSVAAAEQKVNAFSRQLAESYEEISLLYKLGQSMNELHAPLRFVRLACEELHAVLSFGWIAAAFLPDCDDARSLKGQHVICGQSPCAEEEFLPAATGIISSLESAGHTILERDRGGILMGGGTQLLVHPVLHHGRVIGAILAGAKQGDDTLASTPDQKMLDAAAGHLTILLENAGLYEDQQAMFLGTLEALTTSIDAKDPYTCGHSQRVAYLASALAERAGLPKDQVERIHIAGLVHDVGKIGVSEAVLCKPGRLTDEEFDLIKKHPEIGRQILADIPLLGDVLPGVMHHHERYDGRGYPHRLAGDAIPLMARIIGLADAFDAMSSNRTYRAAMNRERVLDELRKGAGTQFDPALVGAFLGLDLTQYDQMVALHHQQALSGDDRFGRPSLTNATQPEARKEAA